MTSEALAEIAELHSKMLDCFEKGQRVEYLRLNHLIHRRVVEIAENPILLSHWLTLTPNVERALANLDRDRWLAAVSEHSKMLAALASRRGEDFARLIEEHFMNGLDFSRRHAREVSDGEG